MAAHTVLQGRLVTENILKGDDDRLMVVVGYVTSHALDLIDVLIISIV